MLPWPVVTYTRCLREYPPRLSLQGSVSRKAIRYSCSEGTLTFSESLSQGRKLDIPTSGHWDGGGRTQPHTESGRVNVASGHCTVQWTAEGGSNRFVPCNCYIHASTSRFLDNSAPSTRLAIALAFEALVRGCCVATTRFFFRTEKLDFDLSNNVVMDGLKPELEAAFLKRDGVLEIEQGTDPGSIRLLDPCVS